MHLESKTDRIRQLLDHWNRLDSLRGEWFSAHGGYGVPNSRRVAFEPATVVAKHFGRRIKRRWLNAQSIGDQVEACGGWTLLEVKRANRIVLQANVHEDGAIEIHQYLPGIWEADLDLDWSGDTIPVNQNFFMDHHDPFFHAWLAENPRPAH